MIVIPSLLINKYTAIVAIIIFIIGIGWYRINKWHYKPFKEQQQLITILSTTVNNLEVDLDKCKADSSVMKFESFFEGGGNIEATDTSNNVFLKRVR